MPVRADASSGMVLLTGNSHPELAKMVSERLEIRLGEATVYNKTNRETSVDIKQSVRGKHVFILQSGSKNVNNDVMELLVLIYACKTSMSKTITVIMPYLPYSKQCRMLRRSSIAMKLVAEMICKAGASRLVSLDLYKKEIQGFFSCPVDNLRASPFFLQHIKTNIPDYKNAIIVAKSPGVMNKATSYADRLRLGVAVIHGEQKDEEESGLEDGRQSPPPNVTSYDFLPAQESKQKPPLTVVGDVGGRIAIMVDDIIDDAQSFVAAAEVLKARGAYKIYVIATHGVLSSMPPLFSKPPRSQSFSPETIRKRKPTLFQVIVTNTVPHDLQKMRCHKIKTVDVSLMICEAIRRIFHNESMGQLFRDVTLDD
ncbi:Protein CBG17449 [Caenorhabditis briggsae]|uniref:Protein CBG17449 n=1 Tax=Caenorhabditis briggsae TaxID=6238 RepID=A8XR21_CAEBR|nr:Protein CBG17449 [Caenorhabditis briggsae]CAP35094.2 Protein CBG17449 [Caenorhabditis briggsae]